MADKFLWQIEEASTINDEDRFLIVVGTSERLVKKKDLIKVLSALTSEQLDKLSVIKLDGTGLKFLTDSGVYKDIREVFSQDQFEINNTTGSMEISDYHTHSNKTILDKFSIEDDTLQFDGESISGYTLPTATINSLGGVKVDGTTITVSEDGTISGSSSYELPVATNGVLGGVKIDGNTIKINDGIISANVMGNWISGVNYPVGYFAVYNDKLYQCNTANSDTEWTESKWNLIAGGSSVANITEWVSGNNYSVGDLIIYENTIYKCNETHTSVTEFDTTKWVGLTGAKGEKGDNGENGISPTLSCEATATGVTVTMADVNGEETFDLSNGQDGINGSDGKSAYQIAVENGFEGNEDAWLESLKGEAGITPHIDTETKHWMIGEIDTGVLSGGGESGVTDYSLLTNKPIDNNVGIDNLSGKNTSNWYDFLCIENMRGVCQFLLLISVYYDVNSSETMLASITLSSPKNTAKFQLLSGMGVNILDQVKITSDNNYNATLYYWNIQFHLANEFATANKANIKVCVELICDPKQFGNINYWIFPNTAVTKSQPTRFSMNLDLAKPFSYNDLRDTPNIPIVDSALSVTSTNPVQNMVITEALANKVDNNMLATSTSNGLITAEDKIKLDSITAEMLEKLANL